MTPEELLIPRFKVISDYPESPFSIGDILKYNSVLDKYIYFYEDGDVISINPKYYPAIFKKLEWWEERNIEELPEYLQEIIDGKQVVYQVFEYDLLQEIVLIEDSPEVLYLENLQPSTKDEYEKTN